jgi:hypothetical protein
MNLKYRRMICIIGFLRKLRRNLSDSDSDHPFPIRYRDSNNVLDYPEDYLDESKWDDWYGY